MRQNLWQFDGSICRIDCEKGRTIMTKTTKHASASSKTAARKPARKAAARTTHRVERNETGSVYTLRPHAPNPNTIMETFMNPKKQNFDRMTQDASAQHKEGVEAMMRSGNIAMKGMEDIFKTCMQVAQNSAEKNAQAVKTLLGCRTLNEFTETQNRVAQSNFDDFMATATRLSELTVKLASEAFEPLNDQFSRSMMKTGVAA
jgi:phasin family protein